MPFWVIVKIPFSSSKSIVKPLTQSSVILSVVNFSPFIRLTTILSSFNSTDFTSLLSNVKKLLSTSEPVRAQFFVISPSYGDFNLKYVIAFI